MEANEKNKKKKRLLWRKMRIKYRFTASNESTLEEEFTFRLSPMQLFLVIVFSSFFLISITSIVLLFTPLRQYTPGYVDSEMRKDIVENASKLDSLSAILAIQGNYMQNIQQIMEGKISPDTLPSLDSLTLTIHPDCLKFTPITQAFMNQFEEEEKYNLTNKAVTEAPMSFFYKPIQTGIISTSFSLFQKHFGIDLITGSNEAVLSTLDGTVVLCCSDSEGEVIQIQHKNNYISIYKHTSQLLKKAGDEVKAGEVIAIVGKNKKGKEETSMLHFELWYKGTPLNPEEYIIF